MIDATAKMVVAVIAAMVVGVVVVVGAKVSRS